MGDEVSVVGVTDSSSSRISDVGKVIVLKEDCMPKLMWVHSWCSMSSPKLLNVVPQQLQSFVLPTGSSLIMERKSSPRKERRRVRSLILKKSPSSS